MFTWYFIRWPHHSVLTFKVVKIHSNKLSLTKKLRKYTTKNCPHFRPGTYVVTQRRSQSPGQSPHYHGHKVPHHPRGHQHRPRQAQERGPSKAAITDLIDQSQLFDSNKARTDLMAFIKSYIRYSKYLVLYCYIICLQPSGWTAGRIKSKL